MPNFLKTSFLWQFAAGFVLGAVGLAALHPAEVKVDSAPTHLVAR